jgi:hypothetical protein
LALVEQAHRQWEVLELLEALHQFQQLQVQ